MEIKGIDFRSVGMKVEKKQSRAGLVQEANQAGITTNRIKTGGDHGVNC